MIFLKAIKNFIDLKFEINLTSLTTKFTNNELKPKQHPKTNPCKTQTKKKKKKIPKPILTSLSEHPHTFDNTQDTKKKKKSLTF